MTINQRRVVNVVTCTDRCLLRLVFSSLRKSLLTGNMKTGFLGHDRTDIGQNRKCLDAYLGAFQVQSMHNIRKVLADLCTVWLFKKIIQRYQSSRNLIGQAPGWCSKKRPSNPLLPLSQSSNSKRKDNNLTILGYNLCLALCAWSNLTNPWIALHSAIGREIYA